MLSLADLIQGVTGFSPGQDGLDQVRFSSVVIDSRLATTGSLFVALRGERLDGHDFIADALDRGAIGVIAEERARDLGLEVVLLEAREGAVAVPSSPTPFCLIVEDSLWALQDAAAFWRRKFDVQVVGVTGSVGKTMTKELVWSVLRQRFVTLKSEGNYNNEIGLPLSVLRLDERHERAVLEMGMYATGEIARLAEIALPRIGVVTNVGPTHLERLGTLERIAQAKAELVEALPKGGVAILNGDDPRVRAMAAKTAARAFCYGLDPGCDLWASHLEGLGLEGIRFRLHHEGQTVHVKAPLLGRHSVHTALAAASVGLVEGLSWEEIVAGLQDVAAQLRLIVVPGIHGSTIIDDTYNASPASAIAALNLLDELEGRKVAVLGDMLELGSLEEEGHRKVGRRAAEVVDKLVAVGPLGRRIGEEALTVGMGRADVFFAASNAEAVDLLDDLIEAGDLVLVKGSRGFRMEEVVEEIAA